MNSTFCKREHNHLMTVKKVAVQLRKQENNCFRLQYNLVVTSKLILNGTMADLIGPLQLSHHVTYFWQKLWAATLRWMVPVFRFFEYVTLKGKNKKSTQRHNKICEWLDCKTCSRPKMTIILSPTVTMATILDDCSDLLLSFERLPGDPQFFSH